MSDLTPPPDEPMPDQARARIRAELLEAAQAPSRSRRWLVPAGVAASVVLVAAVAAWAVQGGDGGGEVAPSTETSESPSAPTEIPSPTAPPVDQQVGHGSCEQELRNPFPGAEQVASIGDFVSFWVAGDQYAVCAQASERTTIHRPLPMVPAESASTYAVSTVYQEEAGKLHVVRVAGGILPDGVTGIRYRLPTGETIPVEIVEDDQGRSWWGMGVDLAAPPGNETKSPPIEVTVSYSGRQEQYTLDWGLDTCAQVNHGC